MSATIIKRAFVVSMDDELGDVPECDILMRDGVIEAVQPSIELADATEIDAARMIAIPGFVDTHRHTWQTNVRGFLPDCTLAEYLAAVKETVAARFRPEDVYAGNLFGALEALNAGVTTMLDWSHISITPDHSDAAVEALQASGIRAVYAHGTAPSGDWWARSTKRHPEDARRLRSRYFSSDDQLLTFALAVRAPGHVTPEVAVDDWRLARELGAPMTVHVGGRMTGVVNRQVSELRTLDLLGPDVTFVHCNDCSDAELDAIAATGGSVSIAPYVEMLMGHGYPPTGRMLERGVRPSLSTDVATSAPGDMFSQMRTAYVAERIRAATDDVSIAFAPKIAHRDVLAFATIDGARVCGLDRRVGSLTPGKDADIVLLRADMLNTAPVVNPSATVVVHADVSNVDSVFVRGRAVKRGGAMLGLDLEALLARSDESRDYLLQRATHDDPAALRPA